MKHVFLLLMIGFLMQATSPAEAQVLKKLKVKASEKTERAKQRADDNVDDKVDQTVDQTVDNAFEKAGSLFKKKESDKGSDKTNTENTDAEPVSEPLTTNENQNVWTKYDFVPGDTVLFEDLLTNEQNGEFPSKWDLKSGNVEIAMLGDQRVINFPTNKLAEIVPLISEKNDYLPEKFTIEFDAYFTEFCTRYTINLYDKVNQKKPANMPEIIISAKDIFVYGKGKTEFEENENYPYWQRVAISFNTRSLKIYFGEERITNIPNLGADPSGFSIRSKQCHTGNAALIKNIRIAKGSMNLYERVVTDGKFITNGIRFDVGKATLRPESMGVINTIVKLLNEHKDLNFSIEGHTDSDGNESDNLKLSEERAEAVKSTLIASGISADRLLSKGYGESKPMDNNSTPEGKANNRRVEFIKM
jgi:outer membrane protein OmpA-like peptidoglycan-associated protein